VKRDMELDRVEYLSPDAWSQWHTELLQSTVNRAYNRVPFYRKRMEETGIGPDQIGSVEDIVKLPFTSMKDISENYPYGLFSVPLRDIVRIHTLRSGQPNPIALGYAKPDLKRRTELTARFFRSAGVNEDDIVQICLDPGMSLHGQDLKEGAEFLGALVIPPDPVSILSRIRVMVDFKTTVLVTTPSYGLYMLETFKERNMPLAALNLRLMILLGETLTQDVRDVFVQELDVETRAAYGIFEACGPTMAYECSEKQGLHLALDHVIPEVIDPETLEVLEPGREGELVITTVTARANPLLRFRTGDITKLEINTCPCGRTTWRMAPVSGRCDQIVVVRGVKISPEHVRNLICYSTGGKELSFLIVLGRNKHLTQVDIPVAIDESFFTGSLPQLHNWIRDTEDLFLESMGIRCRIRPVEYRSILPFLEKGHIIVSNAQFLAGK